MASTPKRCADLTRSRQALAMVARHPAGMQLGVYSLSGLVPDGK